MKNLRNYCLLVDCFVCDIPDVKELLQFYIISFQSLRILLEKLPK